MRLADAVVIGNREALPGVWLLRLSAPAVAQGARPGQMVLLRAHAASHAVLRPGLPIHRIGKGELSLLYADQDEVNHDLAHCSPGDLVAAQGPLGAGFSLAPSSRHILLIADGLGIAALVALADTAVASGLSVTLLAGAETAASLLAPALLPSEVEYRTATADGSRGHHGDVLDLLTAPGSVPLLLWADQVFASGAASMYRRLRETVGAIRTAPEAGFAQVVINGPLGCGLGACLGCAVETRHGLTYLCKHGPVLGLDQILL